MGIVFVVVSISRKGAFKYMPLKLKVSLIGFLIVQIMYDLISVFCEEQFGIEICSDTALDIIQALKNIVYLSVDWLFASHYLRVASLFRMTFASHSLLDFDKVQKRKKWLLILDTAVYTAIFVLLLIKGQVGAFVYFCIMWTIALVSLLSMRHIQKCAKPLE